jgi:flagellar protein FliS
MMMHDARAAYMDASVATANPSRLLVMLCDRLVLDVCRAREAQEREQYAEAHEQLVHAQEIVLELRSSLDTGGFDGAVQLAALYDYLVGRLVRANLGRDVSITSECESLVQQIADTWRQAAVALAQTACAS